MDRKERFVAYLRLAHGDKEESPSWLSQAYLRLVHGDKESPSWLSQACLRLVHGDMEESPSWLSQAFPSYFSFIIVSITEC